MSADQPSLGQMIWLVRRELEWAREVDADSSLKFQVDTVELDVVVEASRTSSGKGGLDLKVLSWGFSGDAAHERSKGATTTVHVVLTPQDGKSATGRYVISGRDTEPPLRRAETSDISSSRMPTDSSAARLTDPEPPPVPTKPDS